MKGLMLFLCVLFVSVFAAQLIAQESGKEAQAAPSGEAPVTMEERAPMEKIGHSCASFGKKTGRFFGNAGKKTGCFCRDAGVKTGCFFKDAGVKTGGFFKNLFVK